MDKEKPSPHTKYLGEQIELWRDYLDHADHRARLIGLHMLRNEIDHLITREENRATGATKKAERSAKTLHERILSIRRTS